MNDRQEQDRAQSERERPDEDPRPHGVCRGEHVWSAFEKVGPGLGWARHCHRCGRVEVDRPRRPTPQERAEAARRRDDEWSRRRVQPPECRKRGLREVLP